MQMKIENMMCGGCAKSVTKAIQKVDADAVVTADPETKLVEVISAMPREAFLPALEAAGFPVS